jgi:hypothetical protein
MFDKAIDQIIEQGGENAPETKQAAAGSEGPAAKPEAAPERPAGAAPAPAEQPGANRPATPGTERQGNQPGGQGAKGVAEPRGFEKGAQKPAAEWPVPVGRAPTPEEATARRAPNPTKRAPRGFEKGAKKPEIAHKDPGQPAEAVTPRVVAASLGKNAKPAEMRTALLKSIDEAIAKAPELPDDIGTTPPKTRGGRVEFSGGRGDIRVEVREGRDGLWHVQDVSLPVKDRARAAEILQAGGPQAARVAVERLLARAEMKGGKIVYRPTETVSFKVPGDGEFKVLNERGRLAEFRAKVEKSPGFSDVGQRTRSAPEIEGVRKGSGGAVNAVANMLEEGDFEAARDYAALKGISLDDVKLSTQDRAKLTNWLATNTERLD